MRLPDGKMACVLASFDDVHPGTSEGSYDGGGDLADGVLGRLERLLRDHPYLKVVLFTVPAWREKNPRPNPLLKRVPFLGDRLHLGGAWPEARWRVDRHPEFCRYLRGLPRVEIAVHGLHHLARGVHVPVEFLRLGYDECLRRLDRAEEILAQADLPYERGFSPPGWAAPLPLLKALDERGWSYLASARDLWTEVDAEAKASASGLQGVPLFRPSWLPGTRIVHIPSNWSATSDLDRAFAIVEAGGVLSVKGHTVKRAYGYVAKDGLDSEYHAHLHELFGRLHERYGAGLWWATMTELAGWFRRTTPSDLASEGRG